MANQPAIRPIEGAFPQNIEAEQAVLGSLLIDVRAIDRIASFLRPDDFYLPVNGEIFRGMVVLYELDRPTDVVTLSDYFHAQNRLDELGGAAYLASLASLVPTSINVEHYARIVERLAVLRRLIDAGNRITSIGHDERFEADAALEEAERVLFDISRLRVTRDFEPISRILAAVYEKIDHIHSHESEITGVTTGFVDLDRLTSGMQRSDLIVLAGRPSTGKTALALNIAHAVAVKRNLPVGIFSIEMSGEQLAQRLIAMEAHIDSQRLRSGRMSDADWDRLVEAVGVLSEAPIFVDDTPILSTVEMRSKARRLHSEQGLGLIVVDYLQLMQGSASENRVQEISAISRGLKAIARELDVPVLALSQLSRAPEQRPNHEPMLSDLRESGCITGDSLVYLSEEVVCRKIGDLAGTSGFAVLAINQQTWKLEPRIVERAFSTGRKSVFRLTTRLGRVIRATANHRFLAASGWVRLDQLTPGTRIAIPRTLGGPCAGPTSADELALPAFAMQYCGPTMYETNLARERTSRVPTAVHSCALARTPESDVYWDQVTEIVPDGKADVYDLTVEGLHNFVADNIIVHNSIEQDSDIVMFIYRDVMYNKDTERPHVADVIVAKHRNGPTGKIHLYYQDSLMRFLDLSVHGEE